jgi:hypothetical protein
MRATLFVSCAVISLVIPSLARADIAASADMTPTATPGGPYAYQYDLTLHNTGDTDINTFWYAWDDSNMNFMTQYPYNTTAPYGWYAIPTYEYDANNDFQYTWGIEWYNYYGSPVSPGQDLSGFGFQSDNTPDELAGLSSNTPINPGDPPFPVGTSFVYQNYPPQQPGDNGFQFVVSPVPEPSTLTLCATMIGLVGFGWGRLRSAKAAKPG